MIMGSDGLRLAVPDYDPRDVEWIKTMGCEPMEECNHYCKPRYIVTSIYWMENDQRENVTRLAKVLFHLGFDDRDEVTVQIGGRFAAYKYGSALVRILDGHLYVNSTRCHNISQLDELLKPYFEEVYL